MGWESVSPFGAKFIAMNDDERLIHHDEIGSIVCMLFDDLYVVNVERGVSFSLSHEF